MGSLRRGEGPTPSVDHDPSFGRAARRRRRIRPPRGCGWLDTLVRLVERTQADGPYRRGRMAGGGIVSRRHLDRSVTGPRSTFTDWVRHRRSRRPYAEATEPGTWRRMRSEWAARAEARRHRHTYTVQKTPWTQRASWWFEDRRGHRPPPHVGGPSWTRRVLWWVEDRRERRWRRKAYQPIDAVDETFGARLASLRGRLTPNADWRKAIAISTASLLIVTIVLAGGWWIASGIDRLATPGRPRASDEAREAVGSGIGTGTDAGGSDDHTVSGTRFAFWSPPDWSTSGGSDGTSVLENPTGDVSIALEPAPLEESLRQMSERAVAALTDVHDDVRLVPSSLTFEGDRSLVLGAEAVDPTGSPTRFLIVAVTGPAGNALITVRFGPGADASATLPTVQRILESFEIRT